MTGQIVYKITFNQKAAHFLGEGVYANGAKLDKADTAISRAITPSWDATKAWNSHCGKEWRPTHTIDPRQTSNNGRVSKVFTIDSDAHSFLERRMKEQHLNSTVANYLKDSVQKFYDRNVWAGRGEMDGAITIEPVELTK